MVSCSHLGPLILLSPLPPFLILGLTLDPLEEGGTDEGNVLMDPIVWDLGPSVWMHHGPKEMGGV